MDADGTLSQAAGSGVGFQWGIESSRVIDPVDPQGRRLITGHCRCAGQVWILVDGDSPDPPRRCCIWQVAGGSRAEAEYHVEICQGQRSPGIG